MTCKNITNDAYQKKSYRLVDPYHDTRSLSKLPAYFTDYFLGGSAHSSACPRTEQINEHRSQQASDKHFWDCNINLSSQRRSIFKTHTTERVRNLMHDVEEHVTISGEKSLSTSSLSIARCLSYTTLMGTHLYPGNSPLLQAWHQDL